MICRGSEGSAKPGKASFLRRGYRSSASAGSKAAPPESKSSDSKPSQAQEGRASPEPLPGNASPIQPPQHARAPPQQLRRHTEGSQAEAARAPESNSNSAQAYGRSGSFSAASRPAVPLDEQKPQYMTPGRSGSLGMGFGTSASDQRRTLSANEDSQAPVGRWCASLPVK